MAARVFAAVDIGASGGRVMAGTVENDAVRLDEVYRFTNGVVPVDGHLRWDLSRLQQEVEVGLAKIPEAESVGIDTWAVDYGLLDDQGNLIAEPVAYRDSRTDAVIDRAHSRVPFADLYRINGLQYLPFTTLYQLVAEQEGELWDRTANAVLIPDLIAYRLTGQLGTEVTNASTTGLLDARTHRWSDELFRSFDLPHDLFPDLQEPGNIRGTTSDGLVVTNVGSHDTASAVVAVPATVPQFAYIASGTWSLVGLELGAPVLSDAAREANFTNELGVNGRTRFLRNVGGLWLLQECLREWGEPDLAVLLDAAGQLPAGPIVDVDDPRWIPPDQMPQRLADASGTEPDDRPALVRCIVDSLAAGYARTISAAERLSGTAVEVVHIVGGGSQNELLCQLTADATGRPVLAGPVEASALGNVLIQARAHGAVSGTLEDLRQLVAAVTPIRRYEPR